MACARRWFAGTVGLGLGLASCIVGIRGEAPIEGEHGLVGVSSVQVDLPSTPLQVVGCSPDGDRPCPQTLRYIGTWRSFGGTRDEAIELARTPAMEFERRGGVAVLRADVPADVRGLVDLELEELELPEDRNLMVRTDVGNVEVFGVRASVVVDVDEGDVVVFGADGGVGVRTRGGTANVSSPAHVDLDATGDIDLVQSGTLVPAVIRSRSGDVRIGLAGDTDLALDVEASGRIVVQTPAIAAVTSGTFSRRTGTGAIEVQVRADAGDVEIRLAPL